MSINSSHTLLKQSVNQKIQLRGRISSLIWQHIFGNFDDYPFSEYFDLEDNFQIIIYSKDKIQGNNLLEIEGTVVEVKSSSKKTNSEEGQEYSEYHILVDHLETV